VLVALRDDYSVAELARQQGIHEQLIYRWKAANGAHKLLLLADNALLASGSIR